VNIEVVANEENQDRSQRRENQARRMISFVSGAEEQVGYGATENGSDNAEHDCPYERQVHVHYGFRDNARE
jgi:hypothetical protein